MKDKKRETSWGKRILETAMVVMLCLMVLLVIAQVIARSIPGLTLQGIEELARLVFVWGCFAGFAFIIVEDRHLRVSALVDRVSPRVRIWTDMFAYVIALALGLIMVVAGMQLVFSRWIYPDFSIALLYPRSLFWLPAPLCGMIIVYSSIKHGFLKLAQYGSS